METDLRATPAFREVEALYSTLHRPGSGMISDAAEISTNGRQAIFAGTLAELRIGTPATRICLTELATGATRVLTFGPNTDRLPKFSPDGCRVAFLSDRTSAGDFQLYLLDPNRGGARAARTVPGWVEYLHWSPDGKRILLGVAGHGADISGGQGAVTSRRMGRDLPAWMPRVEAGDESFRWRSAWVYDVADDTVRQVSPDGSNIWEVAWCGNETLAAVVSPGPSEGLWYDAALHVIELNRSRNEEIHRAQDQLGWLAGSPSGAHLTFVEAVCSDRWVVAGDVRVVELASRKIRHVDTHAIDVTYCEWRSDRTLLLAGHRRFESVVGVYDVASDRFEEAWSSSEITTGGRYIKVSGIGDGGDCAIIGEGFTRPPEIAVIRRGKYESVKSFDLREQQQRPEGVDATKRLSWTASDGLEIEGWLLLPKGEAPFPLVMEVHGGPVGQWRCWWLGRFGLHTLMMLKHGYAVFLPNPRGSSGRGQDFARLVKGDMNGADTYDLLSGLDSLVARKLADPKRLGVMGGSYGGNMTSWLITRVTRFAAAVSIAPHTNQVTERLISNIPRFVDLFLGDRYNEPSGKYFERSAVMHADKVTTPTLNICGALDRCTPPEEAVQFHNALLENGVESVLVTYPEEGHGVRKFPTILDYAVRIVSWFDAHMRA